MPAQNYQNELEQQIPYRLNAVDMLHLALKMRKAWHRPPMQIKVNGIVMVEGNLNGFTNPAIEAGILHGRALLEFLGLRSTSQNELVKITDDKRRDSDIGIEKFETASGKLEIITPEEAVRNHHCDEDNAEAALLAVLRIANKGIAHITDELGQNPFDVDLLLTASRIIPQLVIRSLYVPLGLPAPEYQIASRARDDF
jgi:hypothetical protein